MPPTLQIKLLTGSGHENQPISAPDGGGRSILFFIPGDVPWDSNNYAETLRDYAKYFGP